GNAKPTQFLWTVDLTPPVLTVSGPPRYTNQTSASILAAPNEPLDPNNPYSCALDGQNQVQGLFMKSLCSGVTSLTNLADGQHTLLLSALDAAGNLSAPTGWTWTVDTIPPVTTITSGPSDPTSDTWATFQFEATDATPVTFTCSLDGGPQAPCIPGVTYSDLAPGVHAFSVVATASAQNVCAPALRSW